MDNDICLFEDILPSQVRRYILINFLNISSLFNLMLSNKKFLSYVNDEAVWKSLTLKRFGNIKEEGSWKQRYRKYHQENDGYGSAENSKGQHFINTFSPLRDMPKFEGLEFAWSQVSTPNESSFISSFNKQYLLYYKEQKIIGLDLKQGYSCWMKQLNMFEGHNNQHCQYYIHFLINDHLIITARTTIGALNLTNQKFKWKHTFDFIDNPVPFTSILKIWDNKVVFLSTSSLKAINLETGRIEMDVSIPIYTAYYSYANKIVIDKDILCCHTNKHLVVINLQQKKIVSNIAIESDKNIVIHKRWILFDGVLFSIMDGSVYYLNLNVEDKQLKCFVKIDLGYMSFEEINYCQGVGLILIPSTYSNVIILPMKFGDEIVFGETIPIDLEENEEKMPSVKINSPPYVLFHPHQSYLFLRGSLDTKSDFEHVFCVDLNKAKLFFKFSCEKMYIKYDNLRYSQSSVKNKMYMDKDYNLYLTYPDKIVSLKLK